MTFGDAVENLKRGLSVAREGWNGKKMHVYLQMGSHDYFPKNQDSPMVQIIQDINGVPITLFEGGDKDTITRNPYLVMMGAQGNLIPGWVPTQTDILAEDWDVLA